MKKAIVIAVLGALAVGAALFFDWRRELPSTGTAEAPPLPPPVEAARKPKTSAAIDPSLQNQPPGFDVVRITPKGDGMIAGRAAPMSEVTIYEGSNILGRVEADQKGEWVWVPSEPMKPGSRELSLNAKTLDGKIMESNSVVVLVVPARDSDIAGRPADAGTQPLALKVARDQGAPPVLQPPHAAAEVSSPLAVDTADSDRQGRLSVAGRAEPHAQVQIYLDNKFLGRIEADSKGRWRLSPAETVDDKQHMLRADQVTPEGKVTARVEIPFSRLAPVDNLPRDTVIVVKPGTSLWHIARKLYGTGYDYTTIFEANRDQIKDPSKIYPGQVFTLPAPQGNN